MADLEQLRRTVRVLELLGDSWTADARGDKTESARLLGEASAIDALAVLGIHGGIVIGQIPHPGSGLEWGEYLQSARDELATAEATATAGEGLEPR
jgi:hypothetical protein